MRSLWKYIVGSLHLVLFAAIVAVFIVTVVNAAV